MKCQPLKERKVNKHKKNTSCEADLLTLLCWKWSRCTSGGPAWIFPAGWQWRSQLKYVQLVCRRADVWGVNQPTLNLKKTSKCSWATEMIRGLRRSIRVADFNKTWNVAKWWLLHQENSIENDSFRYPASMFKLQVCNWFAETRFLTSSLQKPYFYRSKAEIKRPVAWWWWLETTDPYMDDQLMDRQ